MKKIFCLTVFAVLTFVLLGCDSDNGGNGEADTSTTLKFHNESGVTLNNVVWNGIQFGNLSTGNGDDTERSVALGGSGSIHFSIEGINVNFKTQKSVLSTNRSFTFHNTTLIFEVSAPARAQPIQLINAYNSFLSTLPTVTTIVTNLIHLLDEARVSVYMVDGIDRLLNLSADNILRTTPIAVTVEHTNTISLTERDTAIELVKNLFTDAGFSNVTINVSTVILRALPTHAEIIGSLTSMGGSGFVTNVEITNYTVNGINVAVDNEDSFPANIEIKIIVYFKSQMFGQMAVENEIKQIFSMANFNNVIITAAPR